MGPALSAGSDGEDVAGCSGELGHLPAPRRVVQPQQAGFTVDQTVLGDVLPLRHHQVVPAHGHINHLNSIPINQGLYPGIQRIGSDVEFTTILCEIFKCFLCTLKRNLKHILKKYTYVVCTYVFLINSSE